jgi:hypothetical protein
MSMLNKFTWVAGCATMLLLAGCNDKKTETPSPAKDTAAKEASGTAVTAPATRTAPLSAGGGVVSAEKTSFSEVTSQLDPGGSLYAYVGTEPWLGRVSKEIGGFKETLSSLPGQSDRDREMVGKVVDLVQRLVQRSGLEEVSGAGWSGIALEKDFYRSKFVLHHYPGKGSGGLWSVLGAHPHNLDALDLLPTNTVMAAFSDLELAEVWAILQKEAASSGIPELEEVFQKLPGEFAKNVGLDFDKTLASLGGEVGIIMTTDESKPERLPMPGGSLTIPTVELMLVVKVDDSLIFDRVDKQLSQDENISKMVVRVDEADLKMRTVPVPLPIPMALRPTVAMSGKYLFVATSEGMVRAALAARSGKGLKNTPEFKRLAAGLPQQGNNFGYVSPKFGETISTILQGAIASMPQQAAERQMVSKIASYVQVPYGYSVGANTPEGWVVAGNGNRNPSAGFAVALVMPMSAMAIVPAIALPAFAKARAVAQAQGQGGGGRTSSQRNACINNLRQLDGAKEQWALENKKDISATPLMSDLIGTAKYIKVQPVCPQGGEYTLGSMGEKPRCSIPGHRLNQAASRAR